MKKESWLIIANSSLARIYKIEKDHHLEEVKVLEHPESRLRNSDLVSDRPGRDFESNGVRRHALEQKTSPKKNEFNIFARELCDYLEESHQQGIFDTLYLAASPALLGILRQTINPNTANLIKGEVDKDMTQLKPHELRSHLPFFY